MNADEVKELFALKFSGRMGRSDYWYSVLVFFLLELAIVVIAAFVMRASDVSEYRMEKYLVVVSKCVAVPFTLIGLGRAARRLHDAGYSAWYFLLALLGPLGAIILTVMYCQASKEGVNQWGATPIKEGTLISRLFSSNRRTSSSLAGAAAQMVVCPSCMGRGRDAYGNACLQCGGRGIVGNPFPQSPVQTRTSTANLPFANNARINQPLQCPVCRGSGKDVYGNACLQCGGRGIIENSLPQQTIMGAPNAGVPPFATSANQPLQCPVCQGSGRDAFGSACPQCGGRGVLR